jgi:hypothetical protein
MRLAVLLIAVVLPATSAASPFEVIVPSTLTVNTFGTSGTGFNTIIINGAEEVLSTALQGQTQAESAPATSNNSDVTARMLLLLTAGYSMLPDTAYVHFQPGATPDGLTSLLTPADNVQPQGGPGIGFLTSLNWGFSGYTGTATFNHVFALGQDVVHYTTFVTFVNAGDGPRFTVTSAGRYESQHDPLFTGVPERVPEPSTLLLVGTGAVALMARRSTRRRVVAGITPMNSSRIQHAG